MPSASVVDRYFRKTPHSAVLMLPAYAICIIGGWFFFVWRKMILAYASFLVDELCRMKELAPWGQPFGYRVQGSVTPATK